MLSHTKIVPNPAIESLLDNEIKKDHHKFFLCNLIFIYMKFITYLIDKINKKISKYYKWMISAENILVPDMPIMMEKLENNFKLV